MKEIRVLVVDDDPSARQTTRAHLDRPGFIVIDAPGGLEAMEVLSAHEIDVILLDAMMPGIDGFETCRQIKARTAWEGIPIIMATALDSQRDRNEGLRAGADDFLTKPINGTELRLRLTAHSKVKAYHSLLGNVLPPRIARRLRDEPGFVADRVENATILFSDLVGFVPFSRTRSAAEVVGVLDQLFCAFDEACDLPGLEKIKTIGDAYMLSGGLEAGSSAEESATKVIEAGLEFFQILQDVNASYGLDLQLRIGVNSGPLIAGVIGQSRLSYDLWGDTVNLASRLESHGLPGHIQLSTSTRALIGDRFSLLPQGLREVKGRGELETWLIKGGI